MTYPCQENSLVGTDGRHARVSAMRCRRWKCEYCAPRLKARLVARALAGFLEGQPVRMITLTSPGDESAAASNENLTRRWKRFLLALRRAHPRMGFEYFKVTERQLRGHAHLHILYRGGFIWKGWIRQAAVEAGFGPVRDIRLVGRAAARYVAKYLAKETVAPQGPGIEPLPRWHRRASWSRGWAPGFNAAREEWLGEQNLARYHWHLANGRPVLVAMRLQLLGYELDAIDYGDLPPRDQAWELERQEPLRWRQASDTHEPCWLCGSDDPARRRPHGPPMAPLTAAPPPEYELWPAGLVPAGSGSFGPPTDIAGPPPASATDRIQPQP